MVDLSKLSPVSEEAVRERYGAAAQEAEQALCCPVDYDPKYLKVIPEEVIEKDYGCGDPSKYLKPGETVLDLGSGTGKICFIASQVVGAEGSVIGVDMTDDMLEVARRNAPIVGKAVGYENVEFVKGRIQDLKLDLATVDADLAANPPKNANEWMAAEARFAKAKEEKPLIADESIDVVVSNCVLNLVEAPLKKAMFEELFRVLRVGGRAVISDIVSDREIPQALADDPDLWSGCISGALREDEFLQAFEDAGFYGIRILKWEETPWRVVDGIEFRSLTIEAFKGASGDQLDRAQGLIYQGPFSAVQDEEGNVFERGKRMAVGDKTFERYSSEPYADAFVFLEPAEAVPEDEAPIFGAEDGALRDPSETAGGSHRGNAGGGSCC